MVKLVPEIPKKDDMGPGKYMSKKEYMTLVLMLFLAAVMGLMIWWFLISPGDSDGRKGGTRLRPEIDVEKLKELEKKYDYKNLNISEDIDPPKVPWKEDNAALVTIRDHRVDFLSVDAKYYFLHMMNHLTDEYLECDSNVTEVVDFRDVYDRPEAYRGKIIEVKGRLYDLFPREDLECQALIDKGGVNHYWDTTIFPGQPNVFRVFVLERRANQTGDLRTGKSGDIVKCRAVFWKVHKFKNMEGAESSSFLLVAKYIEKIPGVTPQDVYPLPLAIAVIVIVFITGGVIFFWHRRDTKKSAEFLAEFRKKHPKKLDNEFIRKKAAGGDSPPGKKPPEGTG